jgi:glycosyltransferase involved in cell wall biosynthesis
MKIAFFGPKKFSDYFKIGGFESFIRRLATGLINFDNQVEYILYDSPADSSIEVLPSLTIRYFQDFAKASQRLITGNYDHVIRVWLYRAHRLKYLFLQRSCSNNTRWHHLLLVWPESLPKRLLAIGEGFFSAPNGRLICVSPRQYRIISRFHQNTRQIFPPVPEAYFLSPENKKLDGKIRVTFLGNLTKDKFIEEIIDLFNSLQKSQKFSFSIFGTYDRFNRHSAAIHERLQSQDAIDYVNVDMNNYSLEVDSLVAKVLKDTDVFVQPYRTLNNTLEMPLLLLEAMASLCAVITTDIGSVPEVYGNSKFIVPLQEFSAQAEVLLKDLSLEQLISERERIHKRNLELRFNITNVINEFEYLLRN